MHEEDAPALETLAKGALAGMAATAALVATRQALWRMEDPETREREMALREGAEATGLQKPVRAAADALGAPLSKEQEQRAGEALAWTLGVAGVVGYAYARRRWPALRAGRGLAFGTFVWAAEDEGLIPALGMARAPWEYPWQAHARGLAAHLAYGVTAEAALSAMD